VEETPVAMPNGFEIPAEQLEVNSEEETLEATEASPVAEDLSESFQKDSTEFDAGGFGVNSPFFANSGGFSSKTEMFEEPTEAGDLNEGWGTNTPTETHASISPFATGSAAPETPSNSMGNSLFGESVAHSFDFENNSPFGEPSAAPI